MCLAACGNPLCPQECAPGLAALTLTHCAVHRLQCALSHQTVQYQLLLICCDWCTMLPVALQLWLLMVQIRVLSAEVGRGEVCIVVQGLG